MRAMSKRSGEEISIGDFVKVKLIDADIVSRKLEFELIEE
jgi:sRNA-binding carbon storage regulator CsrA